MLWTLVENPTHGPVRMPTTLDQRYCVGDECYPFEDTCGENSSYAVYFPIIYLIIIMITGCALSWQSRNLPDGYSEAKYIMLAMYNVALVGTLYAILYATALNNSDTEEHVKSLMLTFCIFITTTGSIGLVFLPKFYRMWTKSEEELKKRSADQHFIHGDE